MRLIIQGGRPLRGEVEVPADKSITHRALMLAAVSDGRSSIRARAAGEDNHSTARVMSQLGARIESANEGWLVEGVGLRGLSSPGERLDCGNSGTTMRLLAGLLAGANVDAELVGDESLSVRPMGRVARPLRSIGGQVHGQERQGRETPPLVIRPGQVGSGSFAMEIASAQVKSALLLAGLSSGSEMHVIEPTPSRDHTERMLRARGVNLTVESTDKGEEIHLDPPLSMPSLDVDVPGDFSSAAFLIAAGALTENSEIRIKNVGLNPGRIGFLQVVKDLAADCQVNGWREVGGEPMGELLVRTSTLSSRQKDGDSTVIAGKDIPQLIDELVVLGAVAARSEGQLDVYDAAELRVKESDRIAETSRLLRAFGVRMEERDDGYTIEGKQTIQAAQVDVSSDHRIALTAAVLALAANGQSVLEGFEVASVSFGSFVDDLRALGAAIEVEA